MTDLTASVFARRLAFAALFTAATGVAAQAQQPLVSPTLLASSPTMLALASTPSVFHADATGSTPDSLAATAGVTYSSSTESVADADAAVDASRLDVPGAGLQPPPRRSYGRPRYNDNSHNPDGSSKYGFEAGIGLQIPLGNTYHYDNTSYAYQVGVVRNFNKNLGVQLQFDWDEFGLNGATLANQEALYNYGCSPALQNAGDCQLVAGLDGNAHVWSFTLDPTYSLMQRDRVGAYAVVGVGFYHKVTNFTLPTAVCADVFCEFQYEENANVDHYTSNAVGFNGGFGVTYKPSKFANERLFVEARYVFVDNSQRQGYTIQNVATTTYNGYNAYPANSNRTTYIPIKVGIRF